ncbi:MAG: sugar transferase [Leptolyngbyaceae cyanobacterium bins.349]|nr:sugar transferase [Leptolyngbyaceae cyanobacterium bins.349]
MISTQPNPGLASPPNKIETLCCSLVWRQNILIVKTAHHRNQHLSALKTLPRLVACLQRSAVNRVRLDASLSEATLSLWAEACKQAGKQAYLRLPSAAELPQKRAKVAWWLKCLVDRVAATLLLLLLSPLLLAIAFLIKVSSPGPVLFTQWRVGKRGRLFQILKFRTMVLGAEQLHHQVMDGQPGLHKLEHDPRLTPLGYWLRQYSLDEFPQLVNVLRGEMSLVGPRPWALYDAARVSPTLQHRLNALPGMTGKWQIEMRSHLRDIDAVNRSDLDYLRNWSALQDFKILLLTIPKVLSRFGAY